MPCPTSLPSWQILKEQSRSAPGLREVSPFIVQAGELVLDASLQRANDAIRGQLASLIDEAGVSSLLQKMVDGQAINLTEQRPVLHMALRADENDSQPWGDAISKAIQVQRRRFLGFAEAARNGVLKNSQGQSYKFAVNIGIGGSDLGPRMACAALGPATKDRFPVEFLSSPDPWAIEDVLQRVDPFKTLFIIQSKSFSTQETMALFETMKAWLLDQGVPQATLMQQFVAVTAQPARAQALGFNEDQTFLFWDWVGGRTSVWSAIGLPIALHCGAQSFEQMLKGAAHMDKHFQTAPSDGNMASWLALFGIWNRNFMGYTSHAVVCYDWRLRLLPAFLQQLEMESNGKSVQMNGEPSKVETAPVLWGGLGLDGQHAYFQMLHQGTDVVPVDFIAVRSNGPEVIHASSNLNIMEENLQAQRRALSEGRNTEETVKAMQEENLSPERIEQLRPHRTYPGNRPSNHLLLTKDLTGFSLGQLLALYEHKVFTQAAIWNIPAFDQWGVELGKAMVLKHRQRTVNSSH
jgi:glucose-6-phosphate isomerase